MKASELRIGNLLEFSNGIQPNEIITINRRFFSSAAIDKEYGDFEITPYYHPIPITHDWLYKLGFENLTHNHEWFDVATYVHKKISFFVHFDGERLSVDFWQGNEKRYVHELQNLFYVLTGEELELMLG